jgi:GNAT superfamily N-acetyltransferase
LDIRDYRESDLGDLVSLFRQLWPEIEQDHERIRQVLRACAEAGFAMFCAVDGARVIGFCEEHFRQSIWRQGTIAYMDILVVDRDSRRSGIGSALMAVAWGRARRAGCDYMELDSAFHREEAHLFYEAHGFEKTGLTFGKPMSP